MLRFCAKVDRPIYYQYFGVLYCPPPPTHTMTLQMWEFLRRKRHSHHFLKSPKICFRRCTLKLIFLLLNLKLKLIFLEKCTFMLRLNLWYWQNKAAALPNMTFLLFPSKSLNCDFGNNFFVRCDYFPGTCVPVLTHMSVLCPSEHVL